MLNQNPAGVYIYIYVRQLTGILDSNWSVYRSANVKLNYCAVVTSIIYFFYNLNLKYPIDLFYFIL